MKTQIFVMTHKKFEVPQDATYIPLQVGRAGKEDLGYLGDDTGDNISEQNQYFGELTGMYWLWKNYHDVDIIGICHYRRYFLTEDKRLMNQADYESALEDADIMVSNAQWADGPYRDYYGQAHNVEDLLKAGEVIKELYPNDYDAFCEVIGQSKFYYGNLCVTSKKIFDEYCEWLFQIFFELQKCVDLSSYDDYHKRLFGFLSEELLLVYITARKLKVKEGYIGLTSEKAETIEVKLAMTQLVKMGEFTQAREMFYEYLKIRPDVKLEFSDIKREIPDIELILYILEQEKICGAESFYAISHQLGDLIVHIRKLRMIFQKQQQEIKLSEEEEQYLRDAKVSDVAKEIIRINM
ncbi:MAG: DUF4422 domain-containing protein [Roseburia sp.]